MSTHATATVMAPNPMVSGGPRRGPRLSTTQPATGVSQVSVAMKIAKAIWMLAMKINSIQTNKYTTIMG